MAMELTILGRNMEVTTRLQNYVEKKTARLDRYMPNLAEVRVDLSEQNARSALDRHVAQITIRDSYGTILRAEERSNDIFAAIDKVTDKLYKQIKRYRGKRKDNRRGGGVEELIDLEPLPLEYDVEEEDEEAGGDRIVRRKSFRMQPMSSAEAIDQMELLGHDFFVFFDAEDEAISVVYRRHDDGYGLLKPELD
jgi:putative sigma-54 modulation protein